MTNLSEEETELHKEREADLGGEPPLIILAPMVTPKLHIAFPLSGSSSSKSYMVLGDTFPL